MAQLNDLLVMGQSTLLGPVKIHGQSTLLGPVNINNTLNVTGTVTITKTTDAATDANNGPALIVGGAATSTHIEIDCNEVLAKSNGTTETDLYLGTTTSKVHIGQDNQGNAAQPVYVSSGVITACSSTVGSATQPVYMSSGTITACSEYAGGTRVSLNGSPKGASTASFYAPTAAGTAGHILEARGIGLAPSWIATASPATIVDNVITPSNNALYYHGTQDAIAGTTQLAQGKLYFVYEE